MEPLSFFHRKPNVNLRMRKREREINMHSLSLLSFPPSSVKSEITRAVSEGVEERERERDLSSWDPKEGKQ